MAGTLQFSTYKSCYRSILRLGLPIVAGQVGLIITGFADNAMLGHYSTEALASSSFVVNFFNMSNLAVMGFSYGLTPLIGARYSRNDTAGIGATMRRGLAINAVFSLIIMAIMAVCYAFLPRMGQPDVLLPLIKPYFIIYLLALLPIAVFNALSQCFYGINDTRTPMWIVLIANALNIFGNWVLIFGKLGMPEMGLTGAGISTLASRVFSAVAIYAVLMWRKSMQPYRQGARSHREGDTTGKIVATSYPVAFQLGFESASFSVAGIMAGWLGAVPLAALQVIVVMGMLGFTIYYGFGSAVAVLVSNASGSNADMRRVAGAGYMVLMVVMSISSSIFWFAGRPIISIFTADPAVIAAASAVIFPLVLYQMGDATQINFANALRGTSNVKPMMWIAFTAYIALGIPATYLLTFTAGLGLWGLVASFSVSLLTAASLFAYFFYRTTRP